MSLKLITYLFIVFELQLWLFFNLRAHYGFLIEHTILFVILSSIIIWFNLIIVLSILIIEAPTIIIVLLRSFETIILNDMIFLVTLNFVTLAVEIVALYLINIRQTYRLLQLLLFGGEGTRYLQIALRVLSYLCFCLTWSLLALRDDDSLHHRWTWCTLNLCLLLLSSLLDPRLIFLLDRLLDVLNLGWSESFLVSLSVGNLLDLRSILLFSLNHNCGPLFQVWGKLTTSWFGKMRVLLDRLSVYRLILNLLLLITILRRVLNSDYILSPIWLNHHICS